MGMPEHERLYRILGGRIRQRRKELEWTQSALAEKAGISRASVVNIEKGRQHPPLHLLFDLAVHLGIEVIALIPTQRELAAATSEVELDEALQKEISSMGDPLMEERIAAFAREFTSNTRNPE